MEIDLDPTRLRITNNTRFRMNIAVTETDDYDWKGDDRPDRNFQNANIEPYCALEKNENLNSWARGAPYRMILRFSNGDEVTFRNDQQDALSDYRYSEIGLGGSSAAKYLAIQRVKDGERNSISINRRPDLKSWMSFVSGGSLLSALTIPGTHDSGARKAGGSYTLCQTMDFQGQLDAGIRYLDVRCRHIQDRFAIHHERVFQEQFFGSDVRDVCLNWLTAHPTETIVMCIKEEWNPEKNSRSFEKTLDWYMAGNSSRWYVGDQTPTLVDVRGKIVLLRRFSKDSGVAGPKGINMFDGWPKNDAATFTNNGVTAHVQDIYKSYLADEKEAAFTALRDAAAVGPPGDWYINFTSENVPPAGTPKIMSASWHYKLAAWLDERPNMRYGIVPMDFPEDSSTLIPLLVAQNRLYDTPENAGASTQWTPFLAELMSKFRELQQIRGPWSVPRTPTTPS